MAYIISLLWYLLLIFTGNAEKQDTAKEVDTMIKSKSAVEIVESKQTNYKIEETAVFKDEVENWNEIEPEPELD